MSATLSSSITTISPQELQRRHDAGEPLRLIDVRTPVEFREVHIPFAHNRPLDALRADAVSAERAEGQPLYVICRSGKRAQKACEKLAAAGQTNLVNVEGGTQAWEQAGLPVSRGKKAISLERQVRICAGFLVFAGALLGLLVHPGFLAIPIFVGAGLLFAGITDTCGMGMLLARMPWNRVSACEGDTCPS